MSGRQQRIAELVGRYVERHVLHGERVSIEVLCAADPDVAADVRRRVEQYELLHDARDETASALRPAGPAAPRESEALPSFAGFRTIERIGRGGMGEVFKLEDLKLGRLVAAKVLRRDSVASGSLADFLREAQALALFQDPRIVGIHEFRPDADPPVIVMDLVEGFPLDRIAPSLEYRQRARIVMETCEVLHRAHELGLTHRDLKPGNILVDARLSPRVLDFGLASFNPNDGHLVGTPRYMAPEQLDRSRPIDARTDVHALGAILYEALCGSPAHDGATPEEIAASVVSGAPRLPAEIDSTVPEPLQAIALKALEKDPALRYQTAREMALDLRRYLDGVPVLARPSLYASALQQRVMPHLTAIDEWLRLALLHPHEALRLRSAYRTLDRREDDWIVESRSLSLSQIALYLGAFVLCCGGLFYAWAHLIDEGADGIGLPFLVLGVPFAGLALAARVLYRRGEHRAVAVAFHLASSTLLPPLLLVLLRELELLPLRKDMTWQLLADFSISNHQLQAALALGGCWVAVLAWRTRTMALSSLLAVLLLLSGFAAFTDLGLEDWIDEGQWDRLGMHLLPLGAIMALVGALAERRRLPWFCTPLYVGAAVIGMAALELVALDGRAFERLGVSLARLHGTSDPVLLDTLAAMSLFGVLFHAAGWLLERRGSEPTQPAAKLLLLVSPFAILEPVAWLCHGQEFGAGWDWAYLVLAAAIAWVSHFHERKSYFYAGLLNTGIALVFIARRQEWLDEPWWSAAVVAAAVGLLGLGLALRIVERRRPARGSRGAES